MIARCNGFKERNDAMCMWGRCYHHYSACRENKGNLSHFLFFYLSLDWLWSLGARAYVYNKQGSMYVSKMCACGEREEEKRKGTFSFFFRCRDRMSMVKAKMDCAWERKKYIYLEKVGLVMKRRQLMTDRLETACF
jgi:hypothetical protein